MPPLPPDAVRAPLKLLLKPCRPDDLLREAESLLAWTAQASPVS